tara:strand:+ start:1109 stop:1312 length:204 start_codon:yes stop_codon:yes gene_type:complete
MLKIGTLVKHLDDDAMAIITNIQDCYSEKQQYRLYSEYHIFHLGSGKMWCIPSSNIYYSYEVINESR